MPGLKKKLINSNASLCEGHTNLFITDLCEGLWLSELHVHACAYARATQSNSLPQCDLCEGLWLFELHVHACACACVCVRAGMCACVVQLCMCMCARTCVCVRVCVRVHVSTHTCVCVRVRVRGWPEPHIYTVYIRCFWQRNHQTYSHIRDIYIYIRFWPALCVHI